MNFVPRPVEKSPVDTTNRYAVGLLLAAAAGLQFQFVLPIGSSGFKLCLADLVLPVGLAMMIVDALRRRRALWPPDFKIVLLAFPASALALGLAVAYAQYGRISSWALIGKFAGWFVLGAYLLMAAELARQAGERGLATCLRAFCWLTVAVNTFFYISRLSYILYLPLDGLLNVIALWKLRVYGDQQASPVANDNGSAVMLICVLAILLGDRMRSGGVFRGRAAFALSALACINVILTGSRAGMGATVLLLAVVFALGAPARRMIAGLLIAITIFLGAVQIARYAHQDVSDISEQRVLPFRNRAETGEYDASVSGRIATVNAALRMWLDHPVLGGGLGSFLIGQEKDPLAIHNTILWIIAEMGIVGFAAYAIFFAGILLHLGRNQRREDTYGVAASVALLVLVSVGAMSMFHELLYQRVPWFILGLAMAGSAHTHLYPIKP